MFHVRFRLTGERRFPRELDRTVIRRTDDRSIDRSARSTIDAHVERPDRCSDVDALRYARSFVFPPARLSLYGTRALFVRLLRVHVKFETRARAPCVGPVKAYLGNAGTAERRDSRRGTDTFLPPTFLLPPTDRSIDRSMDRFFRHRRSGDVPRVKISRLGKQFEKMT